MVHLGITASHMRTLALTIVPIGVAVIAIFTGIDLGSSPTAVRQHAISSALPDPAGAEISVIGV